MSQQLIKGEAFVRQTAQPTWNKAFQESFSAGMQNVAKINAIKKAEKTAASNKVANYINQLNSDIDLTQLTGPQQNSVTNFLVRERDKYAQAASRIAKIDDPASKEYLDLRDQMNGVQRSFANLASQLNKYKEDKISYLKDFDDKRISDGNDIGSLKEASKIYTDEGSMGIGPGGQVTFWNENNLTYENYATIQKPFLKDFKAADTILQLNESIYSAGHALSGARGDMIRNKLKNIINSGGRDTLLSLASDDFLIEGGLNLQDPSLFEPENQDMLSDMVLNSYMDALTKTAIQGARDKRPANTPGAGGFTGALKDEINLSLDTIVPDAMQFSQYSLATPEQRPQAVKEMLISINSIDPTSSTKYRTREDFYNEYLEGMDMKDGDEAQQAFINEYGDYAVYQYNTRNPELSKPLALDVTDSAQLYAFYLKNAGLSTKATNYHLGQYENYLNQLKKNTPSESGTSEGGAYDNL